MERATGDPPHHLQSRPRRASLRGAPFSRAGPVTVRVLGLRQTFSGDLPDELLLACRHALAQILQVEAGRLRLGEHAFGAHLFLLDVVLDLLREHFHLGVIEIVFGAAGFELRDQHLGAVMLDIGFADGLVFDLAAAGGIEDLLFDERVDGQFLADLLREALLLVRRLRLFEFGEQVFDLAVIGLQTGRWRRAWGVAMSISIEMTRLA